MSDKVTLIQLAKPGGGFHRETNGIDPAVAKQKVENGEARIVDESALEADKPVVGARQRGITVAEMESRIDAKLKLLKAELIERWKVELLQLEKRLGGDRDRSEEPTETDEAPEADDEDEPELAELTVKDLREIAAKLDIEGRSKMNQTELIEAITAAREEV